MLFEYDMVRLWERPAERLLVGEERLGPADEVIREQLMKISDPERLERMLRTALKAASWQEIVSTL